MFSLKNENSFALILDYQFHKKRKWVSANSYYMVEAIIETFNPVIISSQWQYYRNKKYLKNILALEPGWSAPKIKYDISQNHNIAVYVSDPHSKVEWFGRYVEDNQINYVLSYYFSPYFYHLNHIPKEKFVHLPWAVPDQFISDTDITLRSDSVDIFGGQQSDAYNIRNWCRMQPGIRAHNFSGVENKKLSDEEYYQWLSGLDAVVAAGSDDPKYDLVTPKYFEVAASGALLFAQQCKDLERLGFSEENCVIFEKETFNELVAEYKAAPEKYLDRRKYGRELIKKRHKVSDRINTLKNLFFL